MDGLFSALFAYNQLKKQGIPEDKIVLSNVQYGDDDLVKKGSTSKGQALVIVDFSAMPNVEQEISDTEYAIKTLSEKPKKTADDLSKLSSLKADLEKLNKVKSGAGKGDIRGKAYHKPDFVSDHHDNTKGDLVPGKGGKIGAKFPSDSEHVAVSYAGNIADWETIKAVSKVDSANYTRLLDTLELPTNFKEKGRMERLAIIVNSLIGRLFKKNPKLVELVIRRANPSLVSVYSTISNVMKLSDRQTDGLEEISSKNPDWAKVDQIRKELPKELPVSVAAAKETKERFGSAKSETDKMREKGIDDIEKAKTGYFTKIQKNQLDALKEEKKKLKEQAKSDKSQELKDKLAKVEEQIKSLEEIKKAKTGYFHPVNPLVIRQDAESTRGYPGRYTGLVLSKGGQRFPFIVKRFSTMLQVAVNPDLAKEDKEKVDLIEDLKTVMKNIRAKYATKYNSWAFDIVEKESGGHKNIATISAMGTLGLMVKYKRDLLKELQELEARAKKVNLDVKEKMPRLYARIKELKELKDKSAEERKNIINDMEREFYAIIKAKYRNFKVNKEQDTKHDIKESFEDFVRSML